MEITIHRLWFTETSTCGKLDIDGVFECFTLEPRADQSQGKPYCIPAGMYKLALLASRKFGCVTPHVLDVPGFTAIEIHMGNFPHSTTACTLVGKEHHEDVEDPVTKRKGGAVWVSSVAFKELLSKIQPDSTITYKDLPQGENQ